MTTLPPPRPECLDSEHRWSEYRNHWHRYARDWRAENARRGEPAVADQQIPGWQEYRAGWMAHWRDRPDLENRAGDLLRPPG